MSKLLPLNFHLDQIHLLGTQGGGIQKLETKMLCFAVKWFYSIFQIPGCPEESGDMISMVVKCISILIPDNGDIISYIKRISCPDSHLWAGMANLVGSKRSMLVFRWRA
jgi:hypothetical protein